MRLKQKQMDGILGTMKCGLLLIKHTSGYESLVKEISCQLASCDKCNFNSVFFYQLQIRSADDDMCDFYNLHIS